MQNAIIKAYTEERERAKQPGYVCTYDDYDGDDFEVPSYGGIDRGAVRSHVAHAPRGSHMQPSEAPVARDEGGTEFGAGVF
jgi:stage V sporulation protein G